MKSTSSPTKSRFRRAESRDMLPNHSKTISQGNSPHSGKKRKAYQLQKDENHATSANPELAEDEKPKKRRKTAKEPKEEKRLRRFRKHAPTSYLERLERVRIQRMFLIDRERKMSEDGLHEVEVFDLAGSTGNIYQVTVDKIPSCNCPDCNKGNQCKHIVYVSGLVERFSFHYSIRIIAY